MVENRQKPQNSSIETEFNKKLALKHRHRPTEYIAHIGLSFWNVFYPQSGGSVGAGTSPRAPNPKPPKKGSKTRF